MDSCYYKVKLIIMKKLLILTLVFTCYLFSACSSEEEKKESDQPAQISTSSEGQEAVLDDESQKNVVKIAVGSPDHTTLVAALKQAELVTALSNAGPFTVFAPTNEAFAKLDKSTLDALMTDAKKEDLQNILQYHVLLSVIKTENMKEGQQLGMVNGDNITLSIKDGKVMVNNSAKIVASVSASNGIVHIIDAVLLPTAKK